MVKALFFKEWLKVKWAFWSMALLVALILVKISLNLSYYVRLMEAKTYWYQVIIMGNIFFKDFTYIPAFIGIVIGFAQFMPEINSERLKLTLHLPLKENSIFMYTILYGTLLLFGLFLVMYGLLSFIVGIFFPFQVIKAMWVTIAPWVLAGFVVYWVTGAVFVERIWLKRIFIIVIAALFVDTLLYNYAYEIYKYSFFYFLILSLLWIISILYTGHRFKKGVMK